MARAAGRKLKVFHAQLGFYDTVVAAPSQAAALRAWGTHQNLFADGQARLTDDEDAVKVALAYPEIPLRRAVGSSDKFAVEPTSLPKAPDAPNGKLVNPKPEAKPLAPPKQEADRGALDAAEAALVRLDEGRKREEADFREKQEELDTARDAAQAAYVTTRKRATAAVVEARRAYRGAGGDD